ncbi:MAG TPA: EAL domain-containing protein [Candidatus Paenibacillus intestinavium]|nr:EAL domain-containing protein [Candidatus Paenibacillus intestinavium]
MKLGIGIKVVLSMLVVVLSAMLTIAFYSHSMTKDILIDQVERKLALNNDNVKNAVSSVFENKGDIVRQMSSIPVVKSFMSANEKRESVRFNKDYEWIQQALTNIKENNTDLHMIWLVHTNNNYFIADHDYVSGPEYSLQERPWYKQASETAGISYSRLYLDYLTNELTISISYPVIVDSERVGDFGVYIHLNTLADLLEPFEIDGQKLILVSNQGEVLYDADRMWSSFEKAQIKGEGLLQIEKDNTNYYGAVGQLDELGWSIVIYVPEEVILEPLVRYERSNVIVWAIAIIILLTTLSLVLHFLLKDIPFIVRQINKIKHGDLSVKIGIKRQDEVGEIAQAVEQMALQIKSQVDELDYQATHDSLTGLANRNLIEKTLQQWIAAIDVDEEMIVVTFLDLDHFKQINDSKGHAYGDDLLIEVGKRISGMLPNNGFFGRFGGDEFVLIMPVKRDAEDNAFSTLQHIHQSFSSPFLLIGQNMYITASMGISLYPSDGRTIEELLITSDTALYHAKEQGRNCIYYFSNEMKEKINKDLLLKDSLRHALLNEEFYLQYQPQLDIRSGKMMGVEALIRWKHPELGMISPAEFIPLAERTGQIIAIGDWVLDASLQMIKRIVEQGVSIQYVAVNVSSIQLREDNFVQKVKEKLIYYSVEPALLELEITESVIIDHQEKTIQKLMELRELGIQIALDDFGTGYSSLNYLRLMPINRVKVDRSFIHRVEEDAIVQAILKTITTLGHSLEFQIVAEGVEKEAQQQILTDMNVDTIQGYYYSRPLDEEQLVEFSRKQMLSYDT